MSADVETSGNDETNRLEQYAKLCRDEVEAYGGKLPSVEIKCDFDYTLHLPANKIDRSIKTVPGVLTDVAMKIPNKIMEKVSGKENDATKVEPFRVLKDVDCCFKAGSLTLVLAPPGHGKTSLLKAVGQILPKLQKPTQPAQVVQMVAILAIFLAALWFRHSKPLPLS